MKSITIGITDCVEYENYNRWLAEEKDVEVIRLSHHQNNLEDIKKCDGVLLTGGEDVHPRFYGKNEYLELCDELNEPRDEFEWKVLDRIEKDRIPLLGICRGLQMANVYFGGTLLPHIPMFGKFDHSIIGSDDRYHMAQVDLNSVLKEVVGVTEGEINSAHHQGVDRIGKGLVANAISPDGVVEGLERQDKNRQGFLLLVQWHPERMKNKESTFSKNVRGRFMDAVWQSKS